MSQSQCSLTLSHHKNSLVGYVYRYDKKIFPRSFSYFFLLSIYRALAKKYDPRKDVKRIDLFKQMIKSHGGVITKLLIPALEQIIKRGGQLGVKEIKIGMSHRGRLNVLANVLQKSYKRIFNEFAGEFAASSEDSTGDVKYHLGASSDRTFDGNSVHVSLTDNPSHLEAVNPVVLGQTRAKQYFHNDSERKKVIPLLIHGDAAFAGQGVVAECFAMSGLKGHNTGGTVHIIVNLSLIHI